MVKTLTKFYGWGGKLGYLIVNEDTVMKKFFKYLGISLASLLMITAIGLYIFYSMYKNWGDFIKASERNDISQMQEILNQGFDINQTLMQVSPLFAAVSYSHINYETIKFMLDNGADVNAKSTRGFLPIHYAIFEKRPDIVKLFLEYGTDVSYKIKEKTLLDIAVISNNQEIINIVKQYQK